LRRDCLCTHTNRSLFDRWLRLGSRWGLDRFHRSRGPRRRPANGARVCIGITLGSRVLHRFSLFWSVVWNIDGCLNLGHDRRLRWWRRLKLRLRFGLGFGFHLRFRLRLRLLGQSDIKNVLLFFF
jgi:hypothetical protein